MCYNNICIVCLKEVKMIEPLKAIAGKSMMTNPVRVNPNMAYNTNYATKGEKLNINCNDTRSVTRNGLKIDYYA